MNKITETLKALHSNKNEFSVKLDLKTFNYEKLGLLRKISYNIRSDL